MNQERIRALVEQATIRVNNPLLNSNGEVVCDQWEQGVSLSLFAELIIRECAKLADEPTSRPYESYGEKIKKHFEFD